MTKLELALQERKAALLKAQEEADLAVALSDSVLDKAAKDSITKDNVARLEAIIKRVNKIDPIITNTGERYNVACYPVATTTFGEVLGRILGLVNTASSMFTTERQVEFSAITGVDYITWSNTAKAFGQPAYFSKGDVSEERAADVAELSTRLKAIAIQMQLPTSDIDAITEDNITAYFLNRKNKATKAKAAFAKSQATLAVDEDYTIED